MLNEMYTECLLFGSRTIYNLLLHWQCFLAPGQLKIMHKISMLAMFMPEVQVSFGCCCLHLHWTEMNAKTKALNRISFIKLGIIYFKRYECLLI